MSHMASLMVSCIITSNTSLPILFIIHAADAGKTWWPGHAEHSDHCLPTIPITSSNLYPLHPRYLISQHIVILIFTLENCDNRKGDWKSVNRLFEGSNMYSTWKCQWLYLWQYWVLFMQVTLVMLVIYVGHVGQSICPLAVGRLPSWSVGGWQGLRVDPLTCTTQPHNAHRHQGNVLKMCGPQATLGILSIPEHNFEQMFLWGAGNWETLFSKPTSLGRMLNGECNMICNMKILSDIEKFNNPELLVAECPSDAYCHRHCWKD